MCSRYSLTSPPEAVRAFFGVTLIEDFPPRYNIAPTQPVLIIRNNLKQVREGVLVRWGLIPSWVKDPGRMSTLINARSETAASKPSFRASLRHRRCLVPADGFYEWTGPRGKKQPHLITRRGKGLLAFAGIWEHWLGGDGSEIETMAILTVGANRDMAGVHDRMPVLLEPENFERWLGCGSGSSVGLEELMQPAQDGLLDVIEVSTRVNNPTAEGEALQEPVRSRLL